MAKESFKYCEIFERSFEHPFRIDILEGVLRFKKSFDVYRNKGIVTLRGQVIETKNSIVKEYDKFRLVFETDVIINTES